MMRKLFLVLVMILLVSALILSGCAQPAPAPSPAPAPKPAPAPTASPTPASAHAQATIDCIANWTGASAYVVSFALSEIAARNHPWLRIRTLEGRGSIANYKLLQTDPEKKRNTIILGLPTTNDLARVGFKPYFDAPYTDCRAIASMFGGPTALLSVNPNITKLSDVAGKRVMQTPPGGTGPLFQEAILRAAGIYDTLKMSSGDEPARKDALKDNLIDVAEFATTGKSGVGFKLTTAFEELGALRKIYYISYNADIFAAASKQLNVTLAPLSIPAGSLPHQDKPFTCYNIDFQWWADKEMDAETVYELCKLVYENAESFGRYHDDGKFITKQTISKLGVPEEQVHPGALKFFREKGLKIE